jgi:hypothetical protein
MEDQPANLLLNKVSCQRGVAPGGLGRDHDIAEETGELVSPAAFPPLAWRAARKSRSFSRGCGIRMTF